MTQMIAELRQALVEAGASEERADAASAGDLATKADVRQIVAASEAAAKADLAALEVRLTWRLVGAVAVLLAAEALDI